MSFYKKIILLFVFVNIISNTYSQNTFNVESTINSYMEFIRKNNYAPTIDKKLFQEENSQDIFNSLNIYYLDSLPKIRLQAYYITYKIGMSYGFDSKNFAINKLVSGCKDYDLGIVGGCFDWLCSFNKDDFNKDAKDSISVLLERKTAHYDKLLKIVGFLDIKEKIGLIKELLLNDKLNTNANKWAAHLALARMGEQDEIDYVLRKVKDLPVNDNLVYDVFPDIIYTRQKQLYSYLIDVLNSNEKNCLTANPESSENIICGYRVMEYLAPVIEDYPIKTDRWGDIIVEDYPNALKLVRSWFSENKGNYTIKSNTF